MNRKSKLALGFTVAAITFGSLMAFTGKGNHFRHSCEQHYGCMKHHDCHKGEDVSKEKPASNPENNSDEGDSTKTDQ